MQESMFIQEDTENKVEIAIVDKQLLDKSVVKRKRLLNVLQKTSLVVILIGIILYVTNIVLIVISYINPLIIPYLTLERYVLISNGLILVGLGMKIIGKISTIFQKVPKITIDERHDKIPYEFLDTVFVIITAYDEEDVIEKAIISCKRHVNNVIVIDDGSEDNTAIYAEQAGAVVIKHNVNCGLAQTLKTGIKTALKMGAAAIVNFDADLQYDANDIPSLVMPVLENRYDLMIGSRFEGRIEEMPLVKKIGNKLFSRLIANLTKTNISDAQSGYRAFSAKFAKAVKIRKGFTYTQQMIIEAAEKHFKIGEIPIVFYKRKNGKSRLMSGIFNFAFKAWRLILRVYTEYHPLKLFSYPIIAFFASSMILLNFTLLLVLNNAILAAISGVAAIILFSTSVIITSIALFAESKKSVE